MSGMFVKISHGTPQLSYVDHFHYVVYILYYAMYILYYVMCILHYVMYILYCVM